MASHVPHPWAWVVVGGYVLLVGVVTIVLCVCVGVRVGGCLGKWGREGGFRISALPIHCTLPRA